MPVQTDTTRDPRRLAALIRAAISPLSSARRRPGSPPAAIEVSEVRHFDRLTSAIAKSATRLTPEDVSKGPRFGAAIASS